jgi:flagellar basal body-associated protein FliL
MMDDRTKLVLLIVLVVLAVAAAVYSGYRSFRQEQGEVKGRIEVFPGGKQGMMERQMEEQGPPAQPPQTTPGGL